MSESKTENYRIPASDTNGHSSRHWFRTIPQMARQTDMIVADKKFPYRTKGDLLRHALHRHIKWLSEQGATVSLSGQVDTIIEVLRDEEMASDFLTVFEKLGERISSHMSMGANGEAVRLIRMIEGYIADMPEGYWRDRYKKKMKERFGHLIESQKKANLGQVEL